MSERNAALASDEQADKNIEIWKVRIWEQREWKMQHTGRERLTCRMLLGTPFCALIRSRN